MIGYLAGPNHLLDFSQHVCMTLELEPELLQFLDVSRIGLGKVIEDLLLRDRDRFAKDRVFEQDRSPPASFYITR